VGLEEALGLFSVNNLDLRLARSRAAEAAGLARQSRAFPNPTVDLTYEPLSQGYQGYSETYINLRQRLEISGERRARGDAADWLFLAAQALVRADSIRLAFTVKRAFVETQMAEDGLAVTRQAVEVFREGERNAAIREAEGDISVYDLQRLRLERVRYENLVADADLAASAARRELAILVLPDSSTPLGSGGPEVGPAEGTATSPAEPLLGDALEALEGFERAVSGRGEVEAAEAEILAARANDRVARAVRIPDLTASAGYKRQSDGFSGAFLGLSVPIPLFDRRGGEVDAAGVRVRAAEERRMLTRRRVEADLWNALESYRSLKDRSVLLDDNGLGGGLNILEIAQVAYDAGEMTLVELMDAAEALRDARIADARLGGGLRIALYDLERALGGFDAVSPEEASTEIGR